MLPNPSPRGPEPSVTGERPSMRAERPPRGTSYPDLAAEVNILPIQPGNIRNASRRVANPRKRRPWYLCQRDTLDDTCDDTVWALGPEPDSFFDEEGGEA
jgi:hypothetical protein